MMCVIESMKVVINAKNVLINLQVDCTIEVAIIGGIKSIEIAGNTKLTIFTKVIVLGSKTSICVI